MSKDQNHLDILRQIDKNPKTNQRSLAKELGLSLGKLNYCLKELNRKRLIKMENFSKNKKKLSYIYLLTPKGILRKTELTYLFLKRKSAEYEELQREIQ
jgi:EPS-associated MarR family transcriptional regulator